MAAKIRLNRVGAKGRPFYRVVVAEEGAPRDGNFIEEIGFYYPLNNPPAFEVNKEKILAWIKKGAQPTEPLRKLLGKAGILKPLDFSNKPKRPPKAKKVEEAKPAAPVGEEKKEVEEKVTAEAEAQKTE